MVHPSSRLQPEGASKNAEGALSLSLRTSTPTPGFLLLLGESPKWLIGPFQRPSTPPHSSPTPGSPLTDVPREFLSASRYVKPLQGHSLIKRPQPHERDITIPIFFFFLMKQAQRGKSDLTRILRPPGLKCCSFWLKPAAPTLITVTDGAC